MLWSNDEKYLLQALQLANVRRGFCAPNPAVGALVVHQGRVVARGMHWAVGYPHAEVEALSSIEDQVELKEVTLYVTLEPCCHQGKTPPCVDFIVSFHKVKRVVFAYYDPNPRVSGQGMAALKTAGIDCDYHPVAQISSFYRSYRYWVYHRRPWVTLKLALSADDKIAGENGRPVAITGKGCHQLTHRHRFYADGLLTTAQTIINDDPRMDVRLPGIRVAKPLFILDRCLRLTHYARAFTMAKSVVIYHAADQAPKLIGRHQEKVQHVAISNHFSGLNLSQIVDDLGARGLHDIWVEVGAKAFRSFWELGAINQVIFYRSTRSLGKNALPIFSDDFNPLRQVASVEWHEIDGDEYTQWIVSQESVDMRLPEEKKCRDLE